MYACSSFFFCFIFFYFVTLHLFDTCVCSLNICDKKSGYFYELIISLQIAEFKVNLDLKRCNSFKDNEKLFRQCYPFYNYKN